MIKRSAQSALLLLSLTSGAAQADTFGFELGAYHWVTDAGGSIVAPELDDYDLEVIDSSVNNTSNRVLYFSLEHPVPKIPNLLITHTESVHSGEAVFSDLFTSPVIVDGEMDLSHTDFTFYYQVLDNIVVDWDLGLTARVFDGHLEIAFSSAAAARSEIDTTLGLLYSKLRFDIPVTGLGAGIELYAGDNGDESAVDANVYLRYESPLGLGTSLGYRSITTKIDNEGKAGSITVDLQAEFDVEGPYINLFYHF